MRLSPTASLRFPTLAQPPRARTLGHETDRLCAQAIDRRGCGDVESTAIFVAPGQVRRLLRHLDRADVVSLGIPNPDSFRACDEEISFAVNLDAVRDSVMLAARFLAEYAAVG